MARKTDNNLVLIEIGDKKEYFTSMSKAGLKVGLAPASVKWAITHESTAITNGGDECRISIVDGSEVPYKYINN